MCRIIGLLSCLLLICSVLHSGQSGPKLSEDPLNAEEIAIYREVIRYMLASSSNYPQINLADKTIPLNYRDFFRGMCNRTELNKTNQGIAADSELITIFCAALDIADTHFPKADENASPLIHQFDNSVVSGLNAFLVNSDRQREKVESIPQFPPCTLLGDREEKFGENCKRQSKELTDRRRQAGLFTVSEILFDKHRQHAVVSYEFDCGIACGEYNSVILNTVDGRWAFSQQVAGGLKGSPASGIIFYESYPQKTSNDEKLHKIGKVAYIEDHKWCCLIWHSATECVGYENALIYAYKNNAWVLFYDSGEILFPEIAVINGEAIITQEKGLNTPARVIKRIQLKRVGN
jgi:hypothetical protein